MLGRDSQGSPWMEVSDNDRMIQAVAPQSNEMPPRELLGIKTSADLGSAERIFDRSTEKK
eukprot:jgi/Pico_ML_1/53740/g4235.t1